MSVQLLIIGVMFPLVSLHFGQASVVAPVANLLAVPVMSLLIVPLVLVSLLLWLLVGQAGSLLVVTGVLLDGLFAILQGARQWLLHETGWDGLWLLPLGNHGAWTAVFLVVALLWLVPPVLGLRIPAMLLAVGVMMARPAPGEHVLTVSFLDVGQGLAVIVQTRQHALLFDTGAAWAHGSMAQRVILPFLANTGIHQLDTLVVSHRDNDHAGGLPVIEAALPVGQVLSPDAPSGQACQAGLQWVWDDVQFSFLHPQAGGLAGKRNNTSCVLLVEAAGRRVLLTGDIEKPVEFQLIAAGLPPVDVLQAPHHGSKTSSTRAFIDTTMPAHVIFNSGYLNRFHHPHPVIVERYRAKSAHLWQTALQGAVIVQIARDGSLLASAWREQRPRFWHGPARTHNYPWQWWLAQ